MTEVSTIIGVAAAAYLATNFDNFAILTALFARYPGRRRWVFAGHMLAVALTVLIAAAIGETASAVSVQYLGYLGLVPVTMGLFWLYRLRLPRADEPRHETAAFSGAAVAAAFLGLMANSADTLLTQAIVFADTARHLDWLIAATVLVAAALLAALSLHSLENSRFGPAVERLASRIAPFIMIGVGLYVFANTATDVLQ